MQYPMNRDLGHLLQNILDDCILDSVGRKEESTFDNVQCTASAHDSNLIAANEKYFAVPWQGGGGPFFINQLDKPGKIDATPSLFQGHSGAVLDLDFSPFDSEVRCCMQNTQKD